MGSGRRLDCERHGLGEQWDNHLGRVAHNCELQRVNWSSARCHQLSRRWLLIESGLDGSQIRTVDGRAYSAESHQQFIAEYAPNFPLLVDSDAEVAIHKGAWDEEMLYRQ